MAELIEIKRVVIGPENMTAFVRLAEDAPLMTSEDLEGTARVYRVMPHIVEHACLGDAGETFREAMGNTELAHLLEHVTVELLAQTDLAGDMPAGRTWVDEVDDRTYQIELACPDDVLVAAALSCGVWILDWAYSGGAEPDPDTDAIVNGLVHLVKSVGDEGEDLVIDYPPEPSDEDEEPEGEEGEWEDEGDELEDDDPEGDGSEGDEPEDDVTEVEPQIEEASGTPLWTEAPEVPTRAAGARRESDMEAEVDQIMATIEVPSSTFYDLDEA